MPALGCGQSATKSTQTPMMRLLTGLWQTDTREREREERSEKIEEDEKWLHRIHTLILRIVLWNLDRECGKENGEM